MWEQHLRVWTAMRCSVLDANGAKKRPTTVERPISKPRIGSNQQSAISEGAQLQVGKGFSPSQ